MTSAKAPFEKQHPILSQILAVPVLFSALAGFIVGVLIAPFLSGVIGGWNVMRQAWDLEELEKPD